MIIVNPDKIYSTLEYILKYKEYPPLLRESNIPESFFEYAKSKTLGGTNHASNYVE